LETILEEFFERSVEGACRAEERAAGALAAMERLVEKRLEVSNCDARLLRAALHQRSADSYHLLVSSDRHDAVGANHAEAEINSASLWRWVSESQGTIWLDVGLMRVFIPDAHAGELREQDLQIYPVDTSASLKVLLGREATHIFAVPLRLTTGGLIGMFTLEFVMPGAIGRRTLWGELSRPAELLATILSPHLGSEQNMVAAIQDDIEEVDPLLPVVGPSMRPRIDLARRFAAQRETLLLSGPSGSGKSRLAQWCHRISREREGPFEVLDLLTVPEEMQMAELVGWRQGAFTSAVHDMDGAIERARGGTLFLDEIDKLSLKTQAGLLRLLEEGTFRKLGERGGAKKADVRFIIGTNVDLEEAVREGRFREDLYWRINVLPIAMLPLDQRREEIIPWARFMLDRVSAERGMRQQVGWSDEALRLLKQRRWPGNLRQLDNIVRRAFVLAITDPLAVDVHAGLLLGARHLRQATRFEHGAHLGGAEGTLLEKMRHAARAFVERARDEDTSGALTLEHAEAFRSLVLQEAAGEQEDYASALVLLGQHKLVEHRNHHRFWQKEHERLSQFEGHILSLAANDDVGSRHS